jgi:hypothetical protein
VLVQAGYGNGLGHHSGGWVSGNTNGCVLGYDENDMPYTPNYINAFQNHSGNVWKAFWSTFDVTSQLVRQRATIAGTASTLTSVGAPGSVVAGTYHFDGSYIYVYRVGDPSGGYVSVESKWTLHSGNVWKTTPPMTFSPGVKDVITLDANGSVSGALLQWDLWARW